MLPALVHTPGDQSHGALVVPSLDDLVEAFLSALSPRTRRAYDGDLRDFTTHVFPDVQEPTGQDVRKAVGVLIGRGGGNANLLALAYRTALEARGLSTATIARRLSALRSICELAGTLGLVEWTLRIKRPKVEAFRDVRGPGRDGWRRMVDRVEDDKATEGRAQRKAIRDLALVRLLHDLMLRRSEAAELDLVHVEFEFGRPSSVWILGKGRTQRQRMELPAATALALADWLKARGLEAGPVFFALDREREGMRLTAPSIGRVVNALGERAGLSRHVTPHGLRHEGITRAVEMGQSLRDVQLAARHKDPRTTQGYIDRQANPQPKISRLISED